MSIYYHGTTQKCGMALLDGVPRRDKVSTVWNVSLNDLIYLHKRHTIIASEQLYDFNDSDGFTLQTKPPSLKIENIVLEEPYFSMAMACAASNARGEYCDKGVIIKYWVDDAYVDEDSSCGKPGTFQVTEQDLFNHGVVIGWYEIEFNPWLSLFWLSGYLDKVYQGEYTHHMYKALLFFEGNDLSYDNWDELQSLAIENAVYKRPATRWPYGGKPYAGNSDARNAVGSR